MHEVRKLVAITALSALALTAFAAPAAAAPGKGTIGLVNGAPGSTRVDLCINGKEIRSKVKYGGRQYKVLSPGFKTIKIYKADPRKCKGKLLGKKTMPLAAGDDFTIVFTRKSPKFTVFANTVGDIPAAPGDPYFNAVVWQRHAADLGAATFRFQSAAPDFAVSPSADPFLTKGDESGPWFYSDGGWAARTRATRPDRSWVFASSPWLDLEASRRYELILLGDTLKNAKFIVWIRPIVQK